MNLTTVPSPPTAPTTPTMPTTLDHLWRSMRVPVVDGLQAQGDLLVIPLSVVAPAVGVWAGAGWTYV
ncbi:MAG: hypothetical protein K0R62_4592, partial [Nonomuraea muscovyensis]|nr:hypothetical protein [Nonomuraea muscovyensis]